ncbi:THAP domain-containing protein 1-like [Scomber scombrus]|uniref:THAP domain-containing protein 1-like n=1 Tax=Scomber scombrus TaxID=13677 RepID=UPI002DD9B001|nr:THAP domain-containing protein 1-like [Scomber scombrus]
MPCFDFLDKVELFLRMGTFPVDASKSSKKVTRAASKRFLYKDGRLWRTYRGRLLRVVRSDEEVREILTRYHDNNNHAGRVRAVKEIMMMYYWVGVTEAVKSWIKACAICQSRSPAEPPDPPVQFCLAYGCDSSSYVYPDLSFHRFPKEVERRRRWLAVAQRDEGSLRMNSCLCSRHFEPSCFTLTEEGQLALMSDAVPNIIPVAVQEEVPAPSDEDFLHSNTLEDLLSSAAAAAAAETTDPSEPGFDQSETPVELQEHQYCLPAADPDARTVQIVKDDKRRKTVIEPSFSAYNQIARYLSHRILPMQSKKSRGALKRMAKRFGLIDGVLMYTRVCPHLRVPRSREEV